jgi:hypothetical protein
MRSHKQPFFESPHHTPLLGLSESNANAKRESDDEESRIRQNKNNMWGIHV